MASTTGGSALFGALSPPVVRLVVVVATEMVAVAFTAEPEIAPGALTLQVM